MRKLLFSLYTVAGAYILLAIFTALVWNVALVPALNTKLLQNLATVTVLPPVLVFFIGAYIGAGFIWVLPGREFDCSPFRVALGSLTGALLGIVIACSGIGIYIILDPYAIDSSREALGGSKAVTSRNLWQIILGMSTLLSLLCARIASAKLKEKPLALSKRAILVTATLLVVIIPLAIMFEPSDFPGSDAAPAKRHDWSKKKAGPGYTNAVRYVMESDIITSRIGEVQSTGPISQKGAARRPYLSFLKKNDTSSFILEVLGEKTNGIASLTVLPDSPSGTEVFGSFTIGDHTVELPSKVF